MYKNYNQWNELKKLIDDSGTNNLYFYEREIWWCSIGLNVGVEINGKHELFERPVLILKVFNKDMVWCLPVTSTIKKSKFYYIFKFDSKIRSINMTQIKTIDSKRLIRKMGVIEESGFDEIRLRLKDLI